MVPLGLRAAEMRAFEAALADNHSIRVRIQVRTLDGDVKANLTPVILDGQVNVDNTAAVTRSASLSILDPDHSMHFDADSPSEGALYRNRLLKIWYGVKVEALNLGWVDVPIFTGPVMDFDRTDDVVQVEAQGMEAQGMGANWRPLDLPKGMPKDNAIRTVLWERAGERRFAIPELSSRLPKKRSLGRKASAWRVARNIANTMDDRQLYYDGRGVCRLRRYPGKALFVFKHGDGGTMMTSPQITFSTDEIRNVVWVKGRKPKGYRNRIQVRVFAPRAHPLSPWKLGRNDVPHYLLEEIEDDAIRSYAEAQRIANRRLKNLLRETVDVAWDSLPVPHLDAGDMVRVKTDEFSMQVRMRQFSIPLTASGVQSNGYLKRVGMGKSRGGRVYRNRLRHTREWKARQQTGRRGDG